MADKTLRIVQLNMGSLLEPDWKTRRFEVVAWLEELRPDVVCLEEAWQDDSGRNTAGWVVEQLHDDWHMFFGGHGFADYIPMPAGTLFGSAILSRWPIDASNVWRMPVGETEERFLLDAPWELVHVQTAGLDIFATHLAPAPEDGIHRRVQVEYIDAQVRAIRGDKDARAQMGQQRPDMPPILCGDFNAEPDSDEIRFLCGLSTLGGRATFWQDAWRVAGDGGPGLTQDWRVAPLAAFLNVHAKRIDYVFVGDPFRREGNAGRVLSARIAFDEPRTGVLASDHFGLVVDVVWPHRP